MTTMDSDSESQDSDEGRRFRFEATRKDSSSSLQSRKRRSEPSRSSIRRTRSRSRDRMSKNRRESDRSRQVPKKESRGSLDSKRISRERDTKHSSKDINDSSRSNSRHSRESKNSSNHKEFNRESPSRNSRKTSRVRSREREREVNKFRDRNRRHSRERSHQGSRPKVSESVRNREEISKTEPLRKLSRRENEKIVKDAEKIVGESDSNSRPSSPTERHECKDLNLSDFDIVSDTEENSSDNSSSRQRSVESVRHSMDAGIKRRVSKQQYERLLKRQAVKKRRHLEELQKVKTANGDELPGTSNNNRSAVSDFLLGQNAVASTAINARQCDGEVGRIDDVETEPIDSDSDTYGPVLPPKSEDCDEEISGMEEEKKEEEKGTRIIGPTLPAHFRRTAGKEEGEEEGEDTFGPALPPHLTQQREDEEDTVVGPVLVEELKKQGNLEEILSESDGDDDFMGPLPVDHPALENDPVQQQLERRARRLKAELAACVSSFFFISASFDF